VSNVLLIAVGGASDIARGCIGGLEEALRWSRVEALIINLYTQLF
jgi:hypothetical protein